MYDGTNLWLPGFAPAAAEAPVPTPHPATRRKALAVSVEEAVSNERSPNLWPAMPTDLWDRSFSPAQRFALNLKALEIVNSLPVGTTPDGPQAEALNLFTGWGALSNHIAFANRFAGTSLTPVAQQEVAAIQGLLGDAGMTSAQAAMTTSFFTPPALARAVWEGIEAVGFKGGNVLDPSAGAGMFLAQMPASLAAASRITAVELDVSTASVLRSLYAPYGVNVIEGGYEKASLPVDSFDLVVTNVPFGNFGVPERRPVIFRDFIIHDYFIARSLELVREGGLVVVLTSAGTMDKERQAIRQYIGARARLLTAVRLPTTVFKALARTEPTVDLLVFQRIAGGRVVSNAESWTDRDPVSMGWPKLDPRITWEHHGPECQANHWFVEHPECVLGIVSLRPGQHGMERYCMDDGNDYLSRLKAILGKLPQTYAPADARPGVDPGLVDVDPATLPGTYLVDDQGSVLVVEGVAKARPIDPSTPQKTLERIQGMVTVRDAARALIEADAANDADHANERGVLNVAYDRFRRAMGPLTSGANTRAFHGDPAAPLLYSLEVPVNGHDPVKAEIFSKRTIDAPQPVVQCDTPAQAVPVSLAEMGYVDLQRVASLCHMDTGKTADALVADGLAYLDPATSRWEVAEAYLSGDVKTKLAQARLAGTGWERNVEALLAVQPEDLGADDITARLGSPWIPGDVYTAFIREQLLRDPVSGIRTDAVTVQMDAASATWSLSSTWDYRVSVSAKNRYAAGSKGALEVMEMTLNQQSITLYMTSPTDPDKRVVNQTATLEAREKQDLLRQDFVDWLWKDDTRCEALVSHYNDQMNRIVTRHYDGSHLTLPGFSNVYTLRSHQKDGIWRTISCGGNSLLGHKVGAGKTLELICSAMELKRLGLATKPAFAVPNNALEDFSKEFLKAYPAANILVATEKDFAAKNRRRFLARVATANWDAVILTHPSFERIRMSDEYVEGFIKDRITELEIASQANRGSLKEIERRKRKWQARLTKIGNVKGDREDILTFDMLGIDWLFIDEAHYFKNLYRLSNMEYVAGLPNSNSERAFDMLMKVRYVQSLHSGGGICFATGTPVSNSMAELYAMQVYLQPDTLARMCVASFDAWATTFGEVVTAVEVAPDGSGYRMNNRFARFVNLPELMGMFHEVADIKMAENLQLPEPDHDEMTVTAESSEALRDLVDSLVKRAEAIHNGGVNPHDDNMLKITTEGRMAALDLRLLGMKQPTGGKIDKLVENVLRVYRRGEAKRLAQVIFCDLGTPGGRRFCVYDAIRDALVASGVDPSDIAYIHDAKSQVAKKAMTDQVNLGNVRIILGSTQRLGIAANLQHRLVALHHLDAPWRPADIEQREGRILRQGNTNDRVTIYRYVTKGSFDAYLWQTLETKARFISQVIVSENVSRSAEDVELAALSYAEVKALASGNPAVLEKVAVDAKVAKLAVLRSAHASATRRMRREVRELPLSIDAAIRRRAELEQDAASCNAMGDVVLETVNGRITDRKQMVVVIAKAAHERVFPGSPPAMVGKVGPFALEVSKIFAGREYRLTLTGACAHIAEFTGGRQSASQAIDLLFADMPREVVAIASRIASDQRKLADDQAEVDKPFDREDRYQELLARQREINASLDVDEAVPRSAKAA